jgi:hypothetical protein
VVAAATATAAIRTPIRARNTVVRTRTTERRGVGQPWGGSGFGCMRLRLRESLRRHCPRPCPCCPPPPRRVGGPVADLPASRSHCPDGRFRRAAVERVDGTAGRRASEDAGSGSDQAADGRVDQGPIPVTADQSGHDSADHRVASGSTSPVGSHAGGPEVVMASGEPGVPIRNPPRPASVTLTRTTAWATSQRCPDGLRGPASPASGPTVTPPRDLPDPRLSRAYVGGLTFSVPCNSGRFRGTIGVYGRTRRLRRPTALWRTGPGHRLPLAG